jgi:N-acetylmuramoyl-L-alanine amidase
MRLRWLAALVALCLLAACGGSAAQDPATPAASPDAAIPAAEAMAGPGPPTVVLDPGHGGSEVGAANHGVVEKDSNLDMALRIERMLTDAGVRVVLTRRDDHRVAVQPSSDDAQAGFGATRFDLQARIDTANAEETDLFLSIHSNGSTDASQNGVEAWYDPARPFGEENRELAEALVASVTSGLRAYGHAALDRGIRDDTCFRFRFERCFPLFVLGPERVIRREDVVRRGFDPEMLGFRPEQDSVSTRATQMPGALVELLFISNAADAAMLADAAARDVIARGVADVLLAMLPESAPQ